MEASLHYEAIVTVDDLEFRVADGLMWPHEVFFAMARRCFDKGQFASALALVNAYRAMDPVDPAAIELVGDIAARGITEHEIPRRLAQAVREELRLFAAMPEATRTRRVRPENYIAIHPFLPRSRSRADRWTFAGSESVAMRVIAPGSDLWSACEGVEHDVFTEPGTGYLPANEDRRIPDFDHLGRQEFIAATRSGQVVGVTRLVYTEETSFRPGIFPTHDHRRELNIFPERERYLESLDPRKVVDLASMAIDRRERDVRVYRALITRSIRRIWETNRRHVLACIDTAFYRKLKRRALDFQDLGPSTYFWGSPTTACILDTYVVPKGVERIYIPYSRIKGAGQITQALRRFAVTSRSTAG